MTNVRKKLIEVSIPLEAINVASAREKSIRHGHPSTLHLWWARRPLAACRAVLFAQLVDDPSAWPERFPTEEAQAGERRRLHKVIERMVPWEASMDEAILNEARWEIARSVAWGRGEEPPPKNDGKAILNYLQTKVPPVYDPFCGGGSIPLEAERLGLRAYGSDLNPVAVLISKALVEIPPKFAGKPPVNPRAQAELKRGRWNGKGAQGLAEDVRYYGQWMRDEAEKRIGHLYPKAKLPDGSYANVIVWLWARAISCPNPACRAEMPLMGSFMLSTKDGKKAWNKVHFEISEGRPHPTFSVESGTLSKSKEKELSVGSGYLAATGKKAKAVFRCMCCGEGPVKGEHIDKEANAGRMSVVPVAIAAESPRGRSYLPIGSEQIEAAKAAARILNKNRDELNLPNQECRGTFASNAQGRRYGFSTFSDYFTPRQLVALTTFSDLIGEAREKIVREAQAAGAGSDRAPLHQDGAGASAYADAVATYLALAVGRSSDGWSSLVGWRNSVEATRGTFARQAVSMVWDFAEANPFSTQCGNWEDAGIEWVFESLSSVPARGLGRIEQADAQNHKFFGEKSVIISTDPPYYDNITYADLSDYFYVWHRRALNKIWPDLYRRLATPKDLELVATPYRPRDPLGVTRAELAVMSAKEKAEAFFMEGIGQALTAMKKAARDDVPIGVYYAFKQSEASEEQGVTSAGWASFLQGVVNAGLAIDGTWPVRTERAGRTVGVGANALASSVVLVCRKRTTDAPVVTRAEFIRTLKQELPDAIDAIRKAGVGPVDMQQSVIGPGMGVFTRYSNVLENDDSPMSVKTALSLINRVWEEIENELDANFDPETQVALAWFATYGFDVKKSGELTTLANAKNIPDRALFETGVFKNMHGSTALTGRDELPSDWSPATDATLTIWECVQHTARVLNAPDGGGEAAARLVAQMGPKAADARALAYRLYEICSQKGWAGEALVYNELAQEWARLEDIAINMASPARTATSAQGAFTFDEGAA